MNRREFLKTAGRGTLAAGASLLVLPRWAHGAAPSDQIRMACIGVKNIGNAHVGAFLRHKDCRIDAICDVDGQILAKGLARVHKRYKNQQAKGYKDFRKVLDRKDIDAVSYGTPDHWHGLMGAHAFAAGKDVYGEKPMAWCFQEARAMLDQCTKHKRVFQLGCQRHAIENMRRCAELLRSGALGTIHTIRCWNGCRAPVWFDKDSDPPPHVDYDLWLGPAPKKPFNIRRFHYHFRFFWDYSGGDYVNWWCHVNDLPQWGVGFPPPRTVSARGEEIGKGIAQAMKFIDVDVDYPAFKYHWTTARPKVKGASTRGANMLFEGDKGTLAAGFGSRRIFMDGKELKDLPDVPKTLPGSGNWHGQFLRCIKSRKPTSANIQYSFDMSVAMFLGRISMLVKRPLTWDPDKEICVGDPEATRMLGRNMRKPWTLPT